MSANPLIRTKDWVRLRIRSADERRLDALRTTFAGRLYRRGKAARNAGQTLGTWGEAADSLLSESEVALRRYDFDTAWACFQEATRMEIFAYDPDELATARTALLEEATDAVEAGTGHSWREQAILRLLVAPDETFTSRLAALAGSPEVCEKVEALLAGPRRDDATLAHVTGLLVDAGVNRPTETAQAILRLADERDHARRTTLYAATALRDEEGVHEAGRLARVRRQLLVLGTVLVAAVVALLMLATAVPVALTADPSEAAGDGLWLYVALFGVLGAGLSAFRSVSSRITRHRVPRHLLSSPLTAMRPLLGAIPALGVFVILSSGVFDRLVRPNTAGMLAVAFLAGFTERWIVRAVEPLRLLEEEAVEQRRPIRGELPVRAS